MNRPYRRIDTEELVDAAKEKEGRDGGWNKFVEFCKAKLRRLKSAWMAARDGGWNKFAGFCTAKLRRLKSAWMAARDGGWNKFVGFCTAKPRAKK